MRHWGFCLILITVVKKSRDYGPRGKSLLYYIPHIPDIPDIPHIPHIPDIPHIPELFDLGISSQTGFFLGGVFGTFFWVGFLAQHGPEPPSPILLIIFTVMTHFTLTIQSLSSPSYDHLHMQRYVKGKV